MSTLPTEPSSNAHKSILSGSTASGPKPESCEEATDFVTCMICKRPFRAISNTHLRSHGMTVQEYKKKHSSQVEAPATKAERLAASDRERKRLLAEDPEFKRKLQLTGKRLAEFRASLPPQQNAEISAKSAQSYLENSTPEERQANSRKGLKKAKEHFPNVHSMGGKASQKKFWQTAAGRARASQRAKEMWKDPAHRANVSAKVRQAVLEGRIPLRPKHVRPTAYERQLVAICAKHNLPLEYTGDNSLRLPIPNGNRSWRNPDFIVPNTRKVVLLDAYLRNTDEEDQDYQAVKIQVLRIAAPELLDEEWVCRKIRRFLSSESSA